MTVQVQESLSMRPRRRRQRKHYLQSTFALYQSLSRLFDPTCRVIFLLFNSEGSHQNSELAKQKNCSHDVVAPYSTPLHLVNRSAEPACIFDTLLVGRILANLN